MAPSALPSYNGPRIGAALLAENASLCGVCRDGDNLMTATVTLALLIVILVFGALIYNRPVMRDDGTAY